MAKPIFIFNTSGDWCLVRFDDHLFDPRGEWVGFVEAGEVWAVSGEWVGTFGAEGRILRRRSAAPRSRREDIPPPPPEPKMPAHAPLPPMMPELRYETIDVLEADPDVFNRS